MMPHSPDRSTSTQQDTVHKATMDMDSPTLKQTAMEGVRIPREQNDTVDQMETRPSTVLKGSAALLMSSDDEDEEDQPVKPGAAERLRRQLKMSAVAKNAETDKDNSSDHFDFRLQDATLNNGPTSGYAFSNGTSPASSGRPVEGDNDTMFVSPSKPLGSLSNDGNESDDADISDNPTRKSRLQQLIARKRAEREAREAGEEEELEKERALNASKEKTRSSSVPVEAESDSDDNNAAGKRLTQQQRPSRKASRKAIEDMNRETQRIRRNQQLAHAPKTKTTFTKDDLFARFNFRQSAAPAVQPMPVPAPQSEEPSNEQQPEKPQFRAPPSDSSDEADQTKDTPPSSPPSRGNSDKKSIATVDEYVVRPGQHTEQIETDAKLSEPPTVRINKGKQPIRPSVQAPIQVNNTTIELSDSDDDTKHIANRFAVFDRIPAQKAADSHSMRTLRALAHLRSPSKRRSKAADDQMSANAADLATKLRLRARQQAKNEREEKIAFLRSKGIEIQTAEEREAQQLEVANMLDKARKEVEDLTRKEREERKKEGKDENDDDLPSSDEDEDYVDDANKEEDEEVQLSGSEEGDVESGREDEEDSEEGEEDEEDGEETAAPDKLLLDNEAEDEDENEASQTASIASDNDELDDAQPTSMTPAPRRPTARRVKIIADDDEEEDEDELSKPDHAIAPVPIVPPATPANATIAAFGFDARFSNPPMGLTQAFAATMNSGSQIATPFSAAAPPTAPLFETPLLTRNTVGGVPHMPVTAMSEEVHQDLELSRLPNPDFTGMTKRSTYAATVISEIPDPSQDVGFEITGPMPFSTVDTLPLHDEAESPPKRKLGRLRRRDDAKSVSREVSPELAASVTAEEVTDAFKSMRKAAEKKAFDRNRSAAKGMVEEQAEESEDEYAGLGGASDDEDGEMDEEMKTMINDGENVQDKARKLAAFHADKQRIEDEKQVEKLYKDIANGGLRKRRGADLEFSDSEDEAEQRRRRKQREHARMLKSLMEDEKTAKIAENPKKAAFFQALSDARQDEELDFLDSPDEPVAIIQDSQNDSQPQAQAADGDNPLKRKRSVNDDNDTESAENRPPAHLRRSKASRKPTSLREVRETLSFLIDEPLSIPETQVSDGEEEAVENSADEDDADPVLNSQSAKHRDIEPLHSRISSANPVVVDRLSLRRAASAQTSDGNLAFFSSSAVVGGFKVPSLLRRATTNSSSSSSLSSMATARVEKKSMSGTGDTVRRGGSKKSSIHYAAREAERRAVVEGVERKRRDGVIKMAGRRRGVLNSLVGGKGSGGFEL